MLEAAPPRVLLNNKPMAFEVDPFILEDRVMVPMRPIFEALGAKVEWDSKSKRVTARGKGDMVILTIGSKTAFRYRSGVDSVTKAVDMDVAPIIVKDRTVVPLRFVSESLSAGVQWNGSESTVYITR